MMIVKTLSIQPDALNLLCTVCVTDNNGGKIALLVIISSLVLLGVANWARKKYFPNKKEISKQIKKLPRISIDKKSIISNAILININSYNLVYF